MGHEIRVTSFYNGITLNEELTGLEFEAIIKPLVEEAIAVADGALSKADIKPSELASVLLAGGTSQIPLVQDLLKEHLGRETQIVSADLMWLIAKGAAIHHRDIFSRPTEATQQILGANLFLETATYGRLEPTLLVRAHQTLPHTCFREFPINAHTTDLTIQLLSQSNADDGEPISLARREIQVSGKSLSKIGVNIIIDTNKTIKVSVVDPTTKLPIEKVEIQGDILSTAAEVKKARENYGLQAVKASHPMQSQRYAIGIDLGTTTCEAMVYDLTEQTFSRGIESPLLSRVLIPKSGTPDFTNDQHIGNRFSSLEDPNNFWNFKVDIGKDTDAAQHRKYSWDGKLWPPEILSAYLLAAIWKQLQEKLGAEAISQAVITVPSDFSHDQNALVEQAAKIAGIANPILLTEPVAAALAYTEEFVDVGRAGQNFLIFDFGGGTTDVCVIKTKPDKKIEELGRNGNNSIGGEKLTIKITDAIIDRFMKANQIQDKPTGEAKLRNRLKDKIDEAKVAISQALAKGDD